MRRSSGCCTRLALFLLLGMSGCADVPSLQLLARPSVAPASQPNASLNVDASQIAPMYDHRMFAVDLPTVVRIATARNLDIREAEQQIEAARGQYEASVGMIFPSITPNVTSLGLQGALATPGGLALATFAHTFPVAVIDWIINPGLVAYNVIASRRRLAASELTDQSVALETTRLAAVQYYDVVLAQAQVAVAKRATREADELLRLERLRVKTGTGLPADRLRAEAALAARRQDLLTALTSFYNASVALTLTLHLDPTVLLVPVTGSMRQTTLVRDDMSIDDMLVTSVRYRPDLEALRTQLAAAYADKGAAIWGGLGPQIQASGTLATRPPAGALVDTMYRQPTYSAHAGFNWSAATFGRIRTAAANVDLAATDVERQLDEDQASVIKAHQASLNAKRTIPLAQEQVTAAGEALRLTRKNLETGVGLTVDVLQAQDSADQARLRYATAIVRYNQAQINLLAALGLVDQASVQDSRLN